MSYDFALQFWPCVYAGVLALILAYVIFSRKRLGAGGKTAAMLFLLPGMVLLLGRQRVCAVGDMEKVGELRLVYGDESLADSEAFVLLMLAEGFTEGEQEKFYESAAEAEADERDTFFGVSFWYGGRRFRINFSEENYDRMCRVVREVQIRDSVSLHEDFVVILVNSEQSRGSAPLPDATALSPWMRRRCLMNWRIWPRGWRTNMTSRIFYMSRKRPTQAGKRIRRRCPEPGISAPLLVGTAAWAGYLLARRGRKAQAKRRGSA